METLDQNNQPGSGASPCRAVAAPLLLAWGYPQDGARHSPASGKGAGSSGSFLLSPPQPDHFVQDPAVLREKAEARRMDFLARKG